MCLVALQDPGLTVFPTHRLVRGLSSEQHEALAAALRRDFEIAELADTDELAPEPADTGSHRLHRRHFRRPFMLTLKDQAIADAALPDHAEPYRRLDTAVLEALILKGALGLTDHDIDELNGLGYARDFDQALELVQQRRLRRRLLHGPDPGRARPGGGRRGREHAAEVDLLLPQGPHRPAVQPARLSRRLSVRRL